MHRPALWALAALALLAAPAAQAQYVYCKFTAVKQGVIRSGTTAKGWEDYVAVFSLSTSLKAPYDPPTGLPTGRRQYGPFGIIKGLDRASPLLFQAATTNENFSEILCQFLRNVPLSGATEPYFQVRLQNARIVTNEVTGNGQVNGGIRESLGFTWERMELTSPDGGTSAVDDWASRS
jgi:type VI secretion system secreted protein Hcp